MRPGLKREAGASPARSRHCNWRELLQSTQRGVTGLLSGLGRPGKIANSQKPGDLPQVLLNAFAERCTGCPESKPDREGRAFLLAQILCVSLQGPGPDQLDPFQGEDDRAALLRWCRLTPLRRPAMQPAEWSLAGPPGRLPPSLPVPEVSDALILGLDSGPVSPLPERGRG